MKKLIILISIIIISPSYSQVSLSAYVDNDSCNFNLYTPFFHIPISEAGGELIMDYPSGNKKYEIELNDSLRVDSEKRYYENGNLAFSGKVLDYSFHTNYLGLSYYVEDYISKTYYTSGKLRHVGHFMWLDSTTIIFETYYGRNNELISQNIYSMGDTISGCYFISSENEIATYGIYRAGNLVERWEIKNKNSMNPELIKIYFINENKMVYKKRHLKKIIRDRAIMWNCGFWQISSEES